MYSLVVLPQTIAETNNSDDLGTGRRQTPLDLDHILESSMIVCEDTEASDFDTALTRQLRQASLVGQGSPGQNSRRVRDDAPHMIDASNFLCGPTGAFSEILESRDEVLAKEHDVPQWDVQHGRRKEGIARLTMVLPTVLRMIANPVGATLCAGGYAIGKAEETFGGRKAVDSNTFRMGFTAWMWSNGIFPSVKYEPCSHTIVRLARIYGKEPSNELTMTPLLVANHVSYLDAPVLSMIFNMPRYVAKAESKFPSIFGKLQDEMEAIFVDRGSSDSRKATLEAITNHCTTWEPGKRQLLIFPEGTTTNGEGILPFKKGAFVTGMPVRPVLVVYTGSWNPATTTYVETPFGPTETTDYEWAEQFLGHLVHSLHVRVLPPYIPSEQERADPELFAARCHEYMSTELVRVKNELHQKKIRGTAKNPRDRMDPTFSNGGVRFFSFRMIKDDLTERIFKVVQKAERVNDKVGRVVVEGIAAGIDGIIAIPSRMHDVNDQLGATVVKGIAGGIDRVVRIAEKVETSLFVNAAIRPQEAVRVARSDALVGSHRRS